MRKYRLFERVALASEPGQRPEYAWKDLGVVEAHGVDAAIRVHADKAGSTTGSFVAVPDRHWNPASFKSETVPKVTLTHERPPQKRGATASA